jgi:HPt (histidine-containing phosphotransfer) domain-containing protein
MSDHIGKPINVNVFFDTLAKWVAPANPSDAEAVTSPTNAVKPDIILQSLLGIDMHAGLAVSMNDPVFFRRMLKRFRDDQLNFAVTFDRARRDSDSTAATRTAHTLKGAAGNIGAKSVQLIAEKLEDACRDNASSAEIERILTLTLDELGTVINSLSSLDTKVVTRTDMPIDRHELIPLIDRLMTLLESNDLAASDVAHELVAATTGTDFAEQIQTVAKTVDNFDVEDAIVALRRLLELLERT